MVTNVLIVDDNVDMQSVIEDCILNHDDIQIIGLAHNRELAFELTQKHKPSLILLSENFQGEQSLEVITALSNIHPNVRIIILSMFAPNSYRQQAIEKGARGFVQYTKIYTDLLPEIQRVDSMKLCT